MQTEYLPEDSHGTDEEQKEHVEVLCFVPEGGGVIVIRSAVTVITNEDQ